MDIAALSTVLAEPVQALSPPVPAADALATERFNAVMSGPDGAGVTGIQGLLQSSMVVAPMEIAPSLGGQILAGLRGAGAEISAKWQSIATGLDNMGVQPSVTEMLRLQSDLMQASIQYEVVGKAVARSTQNVDTLVRMS